MQKLSVHLVTWNGAKYVPALFESLRKQTYQNWKLWIWDNASSDGMVDAMQHELGSFHIPHELIKHSANDGFAGGHNKLFEKTEGEYVLLLNQDMSLMPDCFENMAKFIDTHADVAAVSPRLMKWNFAAQSFTDDIDSLGLKVFRNRRVIEKYTGKFWKEVKPKMHLSFRAERFRGNQTALEVFGVPGTLPMFRRSALEAVAFPDGTFFDQGYGSYKEDVDLCFRLQGAGFKSYVLLDTVAYHDRSSGGPEGIGDVAALKNKRQRHSSWVKYHSYKNHLMTLYKNEYLQNFLLDLPWITWYELKKFVYFLIFDRAVLKGLSDIRNRKKELQAKKKYIHAGRKLSWKQMRAWWT